MEQHTQRDYAALVAAGVDPNSTQPRERAVPCRHFGCNQTTWNQAGFCNSHYVVPATVDQAVWS